MSQLYVVCELGTDSGRVVMGALHEGKLEVSEVHRFANVPIREKNSVYWNIPELYRELLQGLQLVGNYEEPVAGISCVSWPGAYLLIDEDGSLMMPTYHHSDPRCQAARQKLWNDTALDSLYKETGSQPLASSMLFQAAAETAKRFKRARHILPIADGLNYLFSGVPRVEVSMAGATQLCDLSSRDWSPDLVALAGVPAKLLPPVGAAGTLLGPLRPDLAASARLEDTQVISACSHDLACALTGLPFSENERWAFLSPGSFSLMGSPVPEPVLTEAGKELGFRNLLAPGGVGRVSNPSHVGRVSNPSHQAVVYRQTQGLSILDECQNYWESKNKAIDTELLSHLAGSATPFDCLIDPADPRFATAGDMPLKIQAYCRETNQNVPRKPGPIYRCILESLALMYRKILHEICFLTDTEIESIYVLRGSSLTGMTGCHDGVTGCKPVPRGVPLLNHFAANALQLPIFVTSPDTAAIGNIVAQAVALGHIASLEEARAIVRASTKPESIVPHASIWDTAYDRFVALSPNLVEAGM